MNIKDIIAQRKANLNPTPENLIRSFNGKLSEVINTEIETAKSEVEKVVESYKEKAFKEIEKEFSKKDTELVKDINDYFPQFRSILEEELSTILLNSKEKIDSVLEKTIQKMEESTRRIESIKPPKGEKGEKGDDGIGKDGKDGSPDKPDEVVDKVNTANKKIFISSISGLLEELTKIRQSVTRGGGSKGGGMGNTVHEVKDISSATTTITLGSKIAGNGTAIFGARYQGQVLDLGVHYTVSGKTIILLFTPEDGTKFSITYVRS